MSLPAHASGGPPAAESKAVARRAAFLPAILRLQEEAPSPLPRVVLWTVLALFGALVLWACFGRLDVVAVAEDRLVSGSQLRIVQPAEGGVMRELLVKQGERVRAGQLLARMDMRSAEADAATVRNEIALRRLQLRRIDAELGGTRLTALPEDPARLHVQVEAQREARAPADGIVKDLATQTPGAVLSPGTVLMTMVPDGEALVAEVWLANQDAGFVAGGQSAKLKLASFPFQRYGMLDARVARVSADSTEHSANGADVARKGGSYAYRAQLEPQAQELKLGEARHPLRPGMQLTAEIKLAERSVLEYLLSPVQKVAA